MLSTRRLFLLLMSLLCPEITTHGHTIGKIVASIAIIECKSSRCSGDIIRAVIVCNGTNIDPRMFYSSQVAAFFSIITVSYILLVCWDCAIGSII